MTKIICDCCQKEITFINKRSTGQENALEIYMRGDKLDICNACHIILVRFIDHTLKSEHITKCEQNSMFDLQVTTEEGDEEV